MGFIEGDGAQLPMPTKGLSLSAKGEAPLLEGSLQVAARAGSVDAIGNDVEAILNPCTSIDVLGLV